MYMGVVIITPVIRNKDVIFITRVLNSTRVVNSMGVIEVTEV